MKKLTLHPLKNNIAVRLFMLFLFSYTCFYAQVPDSIAHLRPYKLKNFGNNAIDQGDYQTALPYWEQYNKLKPGNAKAMVKLADCYKQMRDYTKAQDLYKKAYETHPDKNITALFYQATMLKMLGDYDKAKEKFQKFYKAYKGSEKSLKKLAKLEINGCDTAKILLTQPSKIVVNHLDTAINKPHMEMSPLSVNDSTFIFSALRTTKKVYEIEGDSSSPVRKFYTAHKTKDKWVFDGEVQEPFNSASENNGNGTYSADGKKFFFSRCKKNWQNKMICAIYYSELVNGSWTEPVALIKPLNNPKYTYTQPAWAYDPVKKKEYIFFVSDLPKGKGGLDIWYTTYNERTKTYKAPRNAGTKINSAGDELTPFYDQETRTFYFSSNGWNGMGGLDVFKITGDPGKWNEISNLGPPINSSADDIYFSVSKNREEGFLVSNRKGGFSLKNENCCDDIYSFKYKNYIHIRACGEIQAELEKSSTTKGIVEANISLIRVDKNKEEVLIKTIQSDLKGQYCLNLEQGYKYRLLVKKDGYLLTQKEISTEEITSSANLSENIKLKKLPKEPIKIDNLYYDFGKASLTDKAKNTLDSNIYRLLINNPEIIIEVRSHTDNKGDDQYNLKLSQKRAESVVSYLISKGIKKERLIPKGYGETVPVAPNTDASGNDNPEGREKNRRTEIKIVGQLTEEVLNQGQAEE